MWETVAPPPQGDNDLKEAKELIGDKITISGNLDLSANQLVSEFQIIRNELEKISGSAELPVDLTSKDNIISPDEPLKIDLEINDLELQFVEEFTSQFKNINGIVNLNSRLEILWKILNFPEILQLIKQVWNSLFMDCITPASSLILTSKMTC